MSVATSACVVCHQKKPRTEMVQVEKTERSGHSNGGGMSWSGGKNKNPRYFGSRRHYHRVRKEWWCKSCYQAKLDEPAPWYVWPILWVVFIYVGYGVGVFAEDMIFQNDGQYSELVFGSLIDMTWSIPSLIFDGLVWIEMFIREYSSFLDKLPGHGLGRCGGDC